MNNNIKSLGYALKFIPALYGCSNSTGKIKETTSLKRPNIILFVTDDHGMDALGCYGNNIIKTPNMDSLAANGVRFTSILHKCKLSSKPFGPSYRKIWARYRSIRPYTRLPSFQYF